MQARHAFTLLGIMSFIVFVGAFFAFKQKAEAPHVLIEPDTHDSMKLSLTSPVFEHNGTIPAKYTCDGENINPELHISNVPEGTVSLALVMDDPDIPEAVKKARGIEKFDHWVLYNIPRDTTVIKEGEELGTQGISSKGEVGYVGMCPPDGTHRYIFRLYALSGTMNFLKTPNLYDVEQTARGMILESAELIGTYERQSSEAQQ